MQTVYTAHLETAIPDNAIAREAADMTSQEAETAIGEIKVTLKWHTAIGSALIAAFVGLLTWYLPKEIKSSGDAVTSSIKLEINKVAKLQLTKLSSQLEEAKKHNVRFEPATLISLSSSIADVAT